MTDATAIRAPGAVGERSRPSQCVETVPEGVISVSTPRCFRGLSRLPKIDHSALMAPSVALVLTSALLAAPSPASGPVDAPLLAQNDTNTMRLRELPRTMDDSSAPSNPNTPSVTGDSGEVSQPVAGHTWMIVGGSVVTGGGLGLWLAGRSGALALQYGDTSITTQAQLADAVSRAKIFQTVGVAAAGVGAATLVTGIVLAIIAKPPPVAAPPPVDVGIGPSQSGGAMAWLSGTWR